MGQVDVQGNIQAVEANLEITFYFFIVFLNSSKKSIIGQ